MSKVGPWAIVFALALPVQAAEQSESKALEADMQDAKGKIEEIKAAPVGAGATQVGAPEVSANVTAAQKQEEERPLGWGATVVLDHSIGTGTFISNEAYSFMNNPRSYVAQSWDIRPGYKFEYMGHKLKLMGRFVFEYEYTTPDATTTSANGRRFKPSDSSIYLIDGELYKEPITEVNVDANVRVFIPSSYESINVKKQWSAVRPAVGLSRSFGPVDVSYGLAMTKYFNSSHVAVQKTTVVRPGDVGTSSVAAAPAPTGISDPYSVPMGFANTSFDIINTFEVAYNFTDKLSAGYSLLIWNTFKYKLGFDELAKSPYADNGRGRSDLLWPSLEVAYRLDDAVKDVLPLKGLTLSGGITALHPAQTADNNAIMWPVFWQAFASNRAADNMGSIYIDLTGTL